MECTHKLKVAGKEITITLREFGGKIIAGDLESNLALPCPFCARLGCYGCDEIIDRREKRRKWNTSVVAIESLIVSHAVAGIDVSDPKYIKGIEHALWLSSNESVNGTFLLEEKSNDKLKGFYPFGPNLTPFNRGGF